MRPKFKCPHCNCYIVATKELYEQLDKQPPDPPLDFEDCRILLEGKASKTQGLDIDAVVGRINYLARLSQREKARKPNQTKRRRK